MTVRANESAGVINVQRSPFAARIGAELFSGGTTRGKAGDGRRRWRRVTSSPPVAQAATHTSTASAYLAGCAGRITASVHREYLLTSLDARSLHVVLARIAQRRGERLREARSGPPIAVKASRV
jgi:hypothetical protein